MAEKNFMYGAAENLRTKMSDSIDAGKNPFEILLELAKMLGEISGEKSFYQTTHEKINAVYGLALNDDFVLEKEIAEVAARLKKIEAAYENPDFTEDERKRIGFALARHKKELERLNLMRAQ